MNFNEAFERFGLSTEYHAIIKDLNEIKTLYQFLMVARRIIAFADKINIESSRLIGRNEAIVERNKISITYREKAMKVEQTILPNVESAREQGYWLGAAVQAQVSEEFMVNTTLDNAAMHKVYEALDSLYGALDKIDENKRKLVPFKDDPAWIAAAKEPMQELGAQKGPGYFRGPDAKYSGPQNVPLKPSGDSDFVMSESECWCVYENKKVTKSPEDKMKPCEMLVCGTCGRMLGSKVTMMPNDKRVYDYGQLKHHPHSGVVEMIAYLCPICNKKSIIQAPIDIRDERKCPFCFAKLTDKNIINEPEKS